MSMFYWKFPCGYVKIEVVCKRSEQFINEALLRGVSLHNIERLKPNVFEAIVRSDEYAGICTLAREIGADVRALSSGGAAMILRGLFAREALVLSILAALAAILVLSRRVLFINVSCSEPAIVQGVRAVLESEGIGRGTVSSSIDKVDLAGKISAFCADVGFAKVVSEGVVLNVRVYPMLNSASEDEVRPANIYADKDCVIISMAVFDGSAAVSAGDAVKKGQLLVNGDITPQLSEKTVLTHSEAEIIGEVVYGFTVCVERNGLYPARSGQAELSTSVELFGMDFASRHRFDDCEIAHSSSYVLDASLLPVLVRGGEAHELVLSKRRLSNAEMLERAQTLLRLEILSAIPENAAIVSKSTELLWESDGSLTLRAAVHTYEKIGTTRYI